MVTREVTGWVTIGVERDTESSSTDWSRREGGIEGGKNFEREVNRKC